jgi:type II secretory pathway pseudopilin PulG
MRPGRHLRPRRERGFTYVAMLFALAAFGVGAAAIGESWGASARREKENELIEIARVYADALNRYYAASPGTPKTFPLQLGELLEDRRFVGTVRHLRKVYRDPMTGRPDWGLIRDARGGIVGVYSLSERETLRRKVFAVDGAHPVSGMRYSEWKFVVNTHAI